MHLRCRLSLADVEMRAYAYARAWIYTPTTCSYMHLYIFHAKPSVALRFTKVCMHASASPARFCSCNALKTSSTMHAYTKVQMHLCVFLRLCASQQMPSKNMRAGCEYIDMQADKGIVHEDAESGSRVGVMLAYSSLVG
jgi:hypothetical protein